MDEEKGPLGGGPPLVYIFDLDTSWTSTGVGKEKSKEKACVFRLHNLIL
jgi:hypothetical protein